MHVGLGEKDGMIDREITIWTDGRTDGQTYGQVVRQVNIAPAMHFFFGNSFSCHDSDLKN